MDKIFLALDIGTTNVKRRDPRTLLNGFDCFGLLRNPSKVFSIQQMEISFIRLTEELKS